MKAKSEMRVKREGWNWGVAMLGVVGVYAAACTDGGDARNASLDKKLEARRAMPISVSIAEPVVMKKDEKKEEDGKKGEKKNEKSESEAMSTSRVFELALEAKEKGDYVGAHKALDEVIAQWPVYSKAFAAKARVYLAEGKKKEALESAMRSIELDYEDAANHSTLGLCYHELGMISQAIASYEEAIDLDATYAWSHNNLGLLFLQKGDLVAALPHLQKAVTIDPSIAIFQNNLGTTLEKLGRISEARAAYRAAIKADSGHKKAIRNLERLKGLKDSKPETKSVSDDAGEVEV